MCVHVCVAIFKRERDSVSTLRCRRMTQDLALEVVMIVDSAVAVEEEEGLAEGNVDSRAEGTVGSPEVTGRTGGRGDGVGEWAGSEGEGEEVGFVARESLRGEVEVTRGMRTSLATVFLINAHPHTCTILHNSCTVCV